MESVYGEIMKNKIENVKADFITHSTYMKGLFKSKQINKAISVYNYV
jgi:pentatricopeptide repeat protein